MTRQEEIRDKAAIWLYNHEMSGQRGFWTLWLDLPESTKWEYRSYALNLLEHLSSKGCVLKVERKLPTTVYVAGYNIGSEDLDKASYVATEPLIKGGI